MSTAVGDFLSCDWGTTSFRLRWVSGSDLSILREVREGTGIKALFDEAGRRGVGGEEERFDIYAQFLRRQLDELAGSSFSKQRLPLVISGMASSTVGWKELPYADVPFRLDGHGLRAEKLIWDSPSWIESTHLLSGAANGQEMMRGEETEAVGLLSSPGFERYQDKALLILPGTHSKHLAVAEGSIVGIRTFMTGELFEVLGRHSLLRASLDPNAPLTGDSTAELNRAAFVEGVRWAQEHGLAGGLFRVRTRVVLGKRPLPENNWFFSGLVIGAELSSLEPDAGPLLLAGGRTHSELYRLAGETVWPDAVWIQIPPAEVELATVRAHRLFLQRQEPEN